MLLNQGFRPIFVAVQYLWLSDYSLREEHLKEHSAEGRIRPLESQVVRFQLVAARLDVAEYTRDCALPRRLDNRTFRPSKFHEHSRAVY